MKTLILTTSILLTMSFAVFAGPTMKPGLWEITSKMEMTGMPMTMPASTFRHCYSQKDLDKGKHSMPKSDDKSCQVKDYKIKGNSASWSMECKGQTSMTGSGTMSYTSTSYSGKMKSKMVQGGKTIHMSTNVSGKRIGDCKN